MVSFWNNHVLKADQPHPRNYLHMLPDYRYTDKHLRLVMALIALNCTGQSPESVRRRTDGRTDRRYQVHYLPRLNQRNWKLKRPALPGPKPCKGTFRGLVGQELHHEPGVQICLGAHFFTIINGHFIDVSVCLLLIVKQ